MTTDNKTLADVQPGGRVRLGDQAERARFEAWNRENWPNLDLSRGPLGDYMQARVRSDWQLWQAALSAQPSPGGQGDAWDIAELVRTDLDRQSCPDAYMRIAMESVVKHLAARQPVVVDLPESLHDRVEAPRDLAARQPVGEPVRVSGDMVDGELSVASAIDQVVELFPSADRAALRTLAACFTHHSIYRYAAPPAQCAGEPVAWMTHHDEPMLFPTAAEAAAYCEDDEQPVPLFRSPAQAVDLGQFREAVLQAFLRDDDAFQRGFIGHKQYAEAEAKRDRLLALIDSQGVGNG